MFGDNSWREAAVADHGDAAENLCMSPHMLLAQALAPQRQQLWPSLHDAPLSEDMLRLHSALHAPLPTCAHVLTNYDGSLRMDVDPSSYTPQTDDVDPSSLETLARLAALRIQQTEGNPAAFVPLVHVDAYGIKQPKKARTKISNKRAGNPIKHDTGVRGVGITSCVLTAVQVVAIYKHLLD